MLVHGEALCQLDTFSIELDSTIIEQLNLIILGLCYAFFLLMLYQKQKWMICHGMRKPIELKLGLYDDCLVDLNEYMYAFPVSKVSYKICVTELSKFCWTSFQIAESGMHMWRGMIVNPLL